MMKANLTKNDFEKRVSQYSVDYDYHSEGYDVSINEEDFTDETLEYVNKFIGLYESKLPEITQFCVESETFQYCYPEFSAEEVIKSLNKPSFRYLGGDFLISYCEHTLDQDHIIDVDVYGLYEDYDVNIDG